MKIFSKIWDWIKKEFKKLLFILGILGMATAMTFNGSLDNTVLKKLEKDKEYCYSVFQDSIGKEIMISLDCDTYHWLGSGPGQRRPPTPEGYTWKYSQSAVNGPMEGEYVIDNDYIYIGVPAGQKRMKLNKKDYNFTEENGLDISPDPPGISVKKGKITFKKNIIGFFISEVRAAVVYDNASVSGGTGSSTTWELVTAGSDRVIVVGVAHDLTVTAVTYAGASLTKKGSFDGANNNGDLWAMANPALDANNVVVTLNISDNHAVGAVSLTGSDGTFDAVEYSGYQSSGSNSVAVAATSETGDMVVDILSGSDTDTWTANGDNTGRATAAVQFRLTMSTGPGAASVNMSWTNAGSSGRGTIVINVNAGTQATPTPEPPAPAGDDFIFMTF